MAYDLVIIGSGPGGYSAAARAGQYGLKTLLIEKDPKLGGTCLHVGCIPTKALLHTADVWDYFKKPDEQGISCKDPQLNYPKVLDRKNSIVSTHAKGVEFLMKKNKVDVKKGYARLLGRRQGAGRYRKGRGSSRGEVDPPRHRVGSRMIPNLQPDPNLILTNIEILDLPGGAPITGHHRRGRSWRGIRLYFQPLRVKSDNPRNASAPGAG